MMMMMMMMIILWLSLVVLLTVTLLMKMLLCIFVKIMLSLLRKSDIPYLPRSRRGVGELPMLLPPESSSLLIFVPLMSLLLPWRILTAKEVIRGSTGLLVVWPLLPLLQLLLMEVARIERYQRPL